MSVSTSPKTKSIDDTRLGVHSAMQPLSGIVKVNETIAVNGNGHGGYIRLEDSATKQA